MFEIFNMKSAAVIINIMSYAIDGKHVQNQDS